MKPPAITPARPKAAAVAAALVVSALVVATLTVASTPARAASKWFNDGTDPVKTSVDVKRVKVTNNRAHNRFAVKVRLDKIRTGSVLVVYLDRNPVNPGPELRMVAYPDSEWALFRVAAWGRHGRQINTCGSVAMSSFDHPHRAVWKAPRGCLKIDGRVRVAVRTVDPQGRHDWAPRRQTFFAPVAAS